MPCPCTALVFDFEPPRAAASGPYPWGGRWIERPDGAKSGARLLEAAGFTEIGPLKAHAFAPPDAADKEIVIRCVER